MFVFPPVHFVFHLFGIFTAVAIDTVFFQLLLFKFLFGMFDEISFLFLFAGQVVRVAVRTFTTNPRHTIPTHDQCTRVQ